MAVTSERAKAEELGPNHAYIEEINVNNNSGREGYRIRKNISYQISIRKFSVVNSISFLKPRKSSKRYLHFEKQSLYSSP